MSESTKPTGSNDPLEQLLHGYIEDYIATNHAARVVATGMKIMGVGFRPIVDHVTFRTLDIDSRAQEFTQYGYVYDEKLGIIDYGSWFAKVYRKPEYPAIFIDQAYKDKRGEESLIPGWVEAFGDKVLHHVAIRVDNIEESIFYLEKQNVAFAERIIGRRHSDLRQIFSQPEIKNGKKFTVLELTERHSGCTGFLPPQANGLMESKRETA